MRQLPALPVQMRDRTFESQRCRVSGLNVGKQPYRDDGDAADDDADAHHHAYVALPSPLLKIALYQLRPARYHDGLNQQSEGRQVQWRAFTLGGTRYDLNHVHPRICVYTQPAKGENPARIYTVEVTFSHHCFTRGFKQDEVPDPALVYADARGDKRIFDFDRYTLSMQLPAIVECPKSPNKGLCISRGEIKPPPFRAPYLLLPYPPAPRPDPHFRICENRPYALVYSIRPLPANGWEAENKDRAFRITVLQIAFQLSNQIVDQLQA